VCIVGLILLIFSSGNLTIWSDLSDPKSEDRRNGVLCEHTGENGQRKGVYIVRSESRDVYNEDEDNDYQRTLLGD